MSDEQNDHESTDYEVGSVLWVAPNPFGESTSYLMLYPDAAEVSDAARASMRDLATTLGLKKYEEDGDIPFIGTDTLDVGLHGALATLWAGSQEWLTVAVSNQWTAQAIARRYIVLVVGATPHAGGMDAQQISDYLREADEVSLGLVRIRLRVESS